MPLGRPVKTRLAGTGEKLRAALQMVGLTWSTPATGDETHVQNNKRWRQLGLPRSINTIAGDIRLGVPAERLHSYADFFGVPPDLFIDPEVLPYSSKFSCDVLSNKTKIYTANPLFDSSQDPEFYYAITSYNDASFMQRLFQLLRGVYCTYLMVEGADTYQRNALSIHCLRDNHIDFSSFMNVQGIDIHAVGRLFRWSGFLHFNYRTTDNQLLGYVLTPDPLSSLLAVRRTPLLLPLWGLSGNVTGASSPHRYSGYARKLPEFGEKGQSQDFATLCDDIRCRPTLHPGEPEHERAQAEMLTLKTYSGPLGPDTQAPPGPDRPQGVRTK